MEPTNEQQIATSYLGFYAHRPFWVGETPSPENTPASEDFEKVMGEVVYSYADDRYSLKACRDGLIMLRIEEIAQTVDSMDDTEWFFEVDSIWPRYLEYLNALNLLIETAYMEDVYILQYQLWPIRTTDAITADIVDDGGRFGFDSRRSYGLTYIGQRRDERPKLTELGWRLDERFLDRFDVPVTTIEKVNGWFGQMLEDRWIIRSMALLVSAVAAYKQVDHLSALIPTWFIIESYLKQEFKKLSPVPAKQHMQGNRKNFRNHRSKSTAEKMVGQLKEAGIIDAALRDTLDRLRRYRNDVVHGNLEWCTREMSRSAIDTAIELIHRRSGLVVQPGLGHKIRCP